MRSKANDKGVELFVLDSGDLHDGSGLSDAVKPGGKTNEVRFNQFLKQLRCKWTSY